jgi:predicted RNase H-like nuclease (RuvC/YqgF family)
MSDITNNIIALSERYSELRAKKDEIKDELSKIEEHIKTIETALIDAMTTAELQNFTRDDGTQFVVVTRQFPSAKPETKYELYQVLKAEGYDDLFTINTQTLQSTIRQWKEEAEWDTDKARLTQLIDPYIRVEERLSISMRKGAKKK